MFFTQQEFCEHIGEDDFLLRYGNPVAIKKDEGKILLCMAIEYYERMTGEKVEIPEEVLREVDYLLGLDKHGEQENPEAKMETETDMIRMNLQDIRSGREHYMVNLDSRLEEIKHMIDNGILSLCQELAL